MNLIRYIAALCDPRDMIGQVKRKPKKVKQCLTCTNPHTHNNSYCSAKCCKEQDSTFKAHRKLVQFKDY